MTAPAPGGADTGSVMMLVFDGYPGCVASDPRTTPTKIAQRGPRELGIEWGDGASSFYDVRDLRLACGCASCIDEWAGENRLDPDSVPEELAEE